MPERVRSALIFLLLLIPSGQFAWRERQMPQFAYLHDDGILFESARSITQGAYRIPSLPEHPFQTKFPPLWPAYLSTIWRIQPDFPANLPLAMLLCWAVLAAYLALAWIYYRGSGFSEGRTVLMVALIGLNPYVIVLGCSMFSDVFFSCWLLGVLLAIRRPGVRMAMLGGLLAACAYLTRTSGIVLLISAPLWMAWRKQWRDAAAFVAVMSPVVAGWMWWTRVHNLHTSDPTLIFYTDYIRYLMQTRLSDLGMVLWKNVDQLLYSIGSMLLPKVFESQVVKILTQVAGVAMISGTVRLARRGMGREYAWFALLTAGILLICNFPSTERYVVPLYPLLVAGLIAEAEHIGKMLKTALRSRDKGQKAAAGVFGTGVAAVLLAGLVVQGYITFVFAHQTAQSKAAKLRDQRVAYTWIAKNLPPSATVLSYDDPLLYLYTGRRGNCLPLFPLLWYSEDHAAIVGAYRELPAYCRRRGLEYVFFTTEDGQREVGEEDQRAIVKAVRANPELEPIFTAGIGTVYRVASLKAAN